MYYQPVYAYFIPNLVPDRQRWFLDGFYTEYHLLKSGIVNLPKRAAYVTDPAELIFDTGLDIVPQYEHIFEETENCQRLPETIRGSVMKVQLFDGALRQTKRMLEADYRTAIRSIITMESSFSFLSVCKIRTELIWHLPV